MVFHPPLHIWPLFCTPLYTRCTSEKAIAIEWLSHNFCPTRWDVNVDGLHLVSLGRTLIEKPFGATEGERGQDTEPCLKLQNCGFSTFFLNEEILPL